MRASSQILTNQDVIDMVALGLSEGALLDKVHTTQLTNFDTTLAGLKALKAANVTDPVIRAMINAHSVNVVANNSLVPVSANATLLPEEIGVYCMCHGHSSR